MQRIVIILSFCILVCCVSVSPRMTPFAAAFIQFLQVTHYGLSIERRFSESSDNQLKTKKESKVKGDTGKDNQLDKG